MSNLERVSESLLEVMALGGGAWEDTGDRDKILAPEAALGWDVIYFGV